VFFVDKCFGRCDLWLLAGTSFIVDACLMVYYAVHSEAAVVAGLPLCRVVWHQPIEK